MSKPHAALRAAYQAAPVRRRKAAPKPRLPKQAELAYLRLAREVTGRMRDASASVLTPEVLAHYAAPEPDRQDARDSFGPAIWRELERLFRAIVGSSVLGSMLDKVHDILDGENRAEVARQLSIRPELLNVDLRHTMDDWRRRNVALITAMSDETLAQVQEVVTTAAQRGTRVESLASEIQARFDVSRSRAELIARDQVLKQNAQLARTRMQRVGVTRYRWSTSHDDRVRPDHAALDGESFEFANPPIVDKRTGERANPGENFQCRCVAIPIFDD